MKCNRYNALNIFVPQIVRGAPSAGHMDGSALGRLNAEKKETDPPVNHDNHPLVTGDYPINRG